MRRLAAAVGLALASGGGGALADVDYGRYLAAECVTCHQASGAADGIPSIVGWPEDDFVAAMVAFQTGARAHDVMGTIARRYQREDLEALAAYFATLGPGSD